MKRLILHIGTHKTGTSSFQESLERNKKLLLSRGVRPILGPIFREGKRVPGKSSNHQHFAHLLLRPEIRTGARVRAGVPVLSDEQRLRRLNRLAQRLSDLEEETLILSAESLCFLRTASEQALLNKFLKDVGRDVRTLVVFRDESDWRVSWENELAKRRNEVSKVARAESEDVSILGDWYYNKDQIREFWEPFNLHEFKYEAHPNMVEAIYCEIGQTLDELQTEVFKNRRKLISTQK